MTVCRLRRLRRCRLYTHGPRKRVNARNNIGIPVLAYRGGGDVLTSSVNELYLSAAGTSTAASFSSPSVVLSHPSLLSPRPSPLLPLFPLPFSTLLRRISSARPSTCSCSSLSLSLAVVPFLFMILRALLCDRQEFKIHEIRTFQIGAFTIFRAPGIIHEPAEKPGRDESRWY